MNKWVRAETNTSHQYERTSGIKSISAITERHFQEES